MVLVICLILMPTELKNQQFVALGGEKLHRIRVIGEVARFSTVEPVQKPKSVLTDRVWTEVLGEWIKRVVPARSFSPRHN